MIAFRLTLAAACAAAFVSFPAAAQVDAGQCIVAGRLSGGQWAPRMAGVQLLGANGQAVSAASRDGLAAVRQVRVAQPALLSRCDGNNPLANNDNDPAQPKGQVPALSAGTFDVESVAFPKLRTGGELVELKVRAAAERVVMVMR
ncbi:MAG TPA: hypothetical protein VIL30_05800 [Ramlibacter sp.]|jgi:hypothetical protein